MPYLVRLRDEAKVPMIYVSHDAGEVRQIASRVVRLDAGKVTAAGGWSCFASIRSSPRKRDPVLCPGFPLSRE